MGSYFVANSGSTVNISGGTVGLFFRANSGSSVNISGGTVGRDSGAFSGSSVNISGGTVGRDFRAFSGSTVDISGGAVGSGFDANSGSMVNISGGTVGHFFDASSGSTVSLSGEEFQIDGQLVPGLETADDVVHVSITAGSVVAGVLSDGTVFSFGAFRGDSFADGTLTLLRGTDQPGPPLVINVPSDAVPSGLRSGQTLNLHDGGQLGDDFTPCSPAVSQTSRAARWGTGSSRRAVRK